MRGEFQRRARACVVSPSSPEIAYDSNVCVTSSSVCQGFPAPQRSLITYTGCSCGECDDGHRVSADGCVGNDALFEAERSAWRGERGQLSCGVSAPGVLSDGSARSRRRSAAAQRRRPRDPPPS